jgi:hypothetical protein
MEKIYCKDCKYFKKGYILTWNTCNHSKCFEIKDFPIEPEVIRIKNYHILNKYNDCKLFERKG